MFIQQLYTPCLSAASYYIESNGECAVIDPMRDIDPYLDLAANRGVKIKYVFGTHLHADFVSGHLTLAQQTGATLIFGPHTETDYPVNIAVDGQTFAIGNVTIQLLHTPGHTPESACFLFKDEAGNDHCIFTGDTLFIGDVGRPDLSQEGAYSVEQLAGFLYESLHQKIMPLADEVIIYPAHGAGSYSGKNVSTATSSTLGEQKKQNQALQLTNKADFIKAVTQHQRTPPPYYTRNVRMNKEGYMAISELLHQCNKPLPVAAFKAAAARETTIILDIRPATVFTQGFIPGAINIGLEGKFSEWAGILLPADATLLLVCDEGKAAESIKQLATIGLENISGYLEGGFAAWTKAGEPFDMIIDVEADELAMDLPHDEKLLVLDVRKETEFAEGHISGAVNIPLDKLTDPGSMSAIEDNDNIYLHCAAGYRSVIAASLLKRQGFHNLRNVLGGWKEISKQSTIPIERNEAMLN